MGFYSFAANASHFWLALKGKLFVRFKCQISKKAQAKKENNSNLRWRRAAWLSFRASTSTQSLAAQKMQFNYVNSWADENSANRKARKKTLRGYNGCLKMQSYNEKKGSSSWKIFCVVCFPQKMGLKFTITKKGRLLNRFHIVKALEKSTEATRSIQKCFASWILTWPVPGFELWPRYNREKQVRKNQTQDIHT